MNHVENATRYTLENAITANSGTPEERYDWHDRFDEWPEESIDNLRGVPMTDDEMVQSDGDCYF